MLLDSQKGTIFIKPNYLHQNVGTLTVQWNLDLRKILGVTKIFLKSRFFLISNTRKPLKKHKFENEHLKQYKCCIALSLSNASDYICRYVHSLIRKIWKYIFFKLKNFTFFLKLLENCQKVHIS